MTDCTIEGFRDGTMRCVLEDEHECFLDRPPLPDEVVEAIRDSLAPFLESIRTTTNKEIPA